MIERILDKSFDAGPSFFGWISISWLMVSHDTSLRESRIATKSCSNLLGINNKHPLQRKFSNPRSAYRFFSRFFCLVFASSSINAESSWLAFAKTWDFACCSESCLSKRKGAKSYHFLWNTLLFLKSPIDQEITICWGYSWLFYIWARLDMNDTSTVLLPLLVMVVVEKVQSW